MTTTVSIRIDRSSLSNLDALRSRVAALLPSPIPATLTISITSEPALILSYTETAADLPTAAAAAIATLNRLTRA